MNTISNKRLSRILRSIDVHSRKSLKRILMDTKAKYFYYNAKGRYINSIAWCVADTRPMMQNNTEGSVTIKRALEVLA